MNLFEVSDIYLNRIVGKTDTKPTLSTNILPSSRIKVLLLDTKTTTIISLNSTQSELLQNDIYLISRLDNSNRDKLRHLKCLVYIQPNDGSIQNLLDELRNPKYNSYELIFNNTISKSQLERIAESDDLEVVTKVEEIFQDYLTINEHLFSLQLPNIYGDTLDSWQGTAFTSSVNGLSSLLLSLKQKPIIRYEANSKMSSKLSKEILYNITKTNSTLFDFKLKNTPPVLLILDRKNDPITPLLNPWTYQSMVHQLIGIENNTVDLSGFPGVSEDLQKIVLSSKLDQFFKDSLYLNFGDLSDKIKEYVSSYKSKTNSNKNIESIDDMKKFIEEFPELKKLSGNVTKHMTVISELNNIINKERLWQVSELEQDISSHEQHNQHYEELEALILNKVGNAEGIISPPISDESKIKLVSLYALRYELHNSNQIQKLKQILLSQGISPARIAVIDYLLRSSGLRKRLDDEQSIFDKATSNLISGIKTSHSQDNVYMQHVPRLENLLNQIIRGKLNDKNYPILSPYNDNIYGSGNLQFEKAQEIIVFIIGGVTFEEGRIVEQLNKLNKNVRIILGGTTIHNSKSYLNEVQQSGEKWPTDNVSERLQSRLN